MDKIKFFFLFLLAGALMSSCEKPSLEEDARKAAEYSNLSNMMTQDSDFGSAAKYYEDAQAIIDKYRDTDRFRDFFMLYRGFLGAGAYEQMEDFVNETISSADDQLNS